MNFNSSTLAFDADGKLRHFDGKTAWTRDPNDGKPLRQCELAIAKGAAAAHWTRFSPKGSLLALRDEVDSVRLFELANGKETQRFKLKVDPDAGFSLFGQTLAFTPDGQTLAVASEGKRIEVFDVAGGKRRFDLEIPVAEVNHIDFSPNGRDLFCLQRDKERIVLRDWAGKKEVVRLAGSSWHGISAFSADGRQLAVVTDDDVGLFDVATGKEIRRIAAAGCWKLAFAPDGRTLLTASGIGPMAQWDADTGKLLPASADPVGGLRLVRFSPDGKRVVGYAGRHLNFDTQSGRLLGPAAEAEAAYPREATLSPDGTLLALARDGKLLLLDAQTGKEVHRFAGGFFVFGPTGTLYSAGNDEVIRVFDSGSREPPRTLKGPPLQLSPIRDALVVSAGGRWLAAACRPEGGGAENYDVAIWDTHAAKLVHRLTGRGSASYVVAFSPDGKYFAQARADPDARTFRIYVSLMDLRTGTEKRVIAVVENEVTGIVFSRDSRTLATADYEGALRFWEVAVGRERHRFEGHTSNIYSVIFSTDGALMASASRDAPAFIWDIYGKHAKAPPEKWSDADRHRLWQDLAGADAKAGFQAVRRMVRNPGPAVALIGERLKPAEAVDAKRFKQWLRDLDSDDYGIRRSATADLEKLGDRIATALQEGLTSGLTLEARRRVQGLLDKLDEPTFERLARWRALEALEQIDTSEALKLLEALAGGERGARLTREATDMLNRLRKR
jgi:WD40 repeat protein